MCSSISSYFFLENTIFKLQNFKNPKSKMKNTYKNIKNAIFVTKLQDIQYVTSHVGSTRRVVGERDAETVDIVFVYFI